MLGLQLDLQGVDRASQLDDLGLVGLQLLRAGHYLLVQLLGLQYPREGDSVRPCLKGPGGLASWETRCLDTHLCGEPFLHFPAVGVHQRLILTPGLIEHTVQVHGGGRIHLDVEAVSKLAAQGVDFLMEEGERMNPQKLMCYLPAVGGSEVSTNLPKMH